jgi:hypothetical protein
MEHKVVGWSVNNKLERMWKEQLGAKLGYTPGFCLERLKKAMKPSIGLAGLPINVQKCRLSDRYQKCYHLNHLV